MSDDTSYWPSLDIKHGPLQCFAGFYDIKHYDDFDLDHYDK